MSKISTPRKALSKGYLKSTVTRSEIDQFKEAYKVMMSKIDPNQNEAFLTNVVRDFLLKAYYTGKNSINVDGYIDLVINNGPKAEDSVGVIVEMKSIANKNEMVTRDNQYDSHNKREY